MNKDAVTPIIPADYTVSARRNMGRLLGSFAIAAVLVDMAHASPLSDMRAIAVALANPDFTALAITLKEQPANHARLFGADNALLLPDGWRHELCAVDFSISSTAFVWSDGFDGDDPE